MPVLSVQKRDSQDSLSIVRTSHYEHKAKSEPGAVATELKLIGLPHKQVDG
jgi:hypothetical protein